MQLPIDIDLTGRLFSTDTQDLQSISKLIHNNWTLRICNDLQKDRRNLWVSYNLLKSTRHCRHHNLYRLLHLRLLRLILCCNCCNIAIKFRTWLGNDCLGGWRSNPDERGSSSRYRRVSFSSEISEIDRHRYVVCGRRWSRPIEWTTKQATSERILHEDLWPQSPVLAFVLLTWRCVSRSTARITRWSYGGLFRCGKQPTYPSPRLTS